MSDDSRVALMSVIRLTVGCANVLAGYLMWRSASVRSSIAINGVLGSVLPLVFMLVMAIGVSGLATRVPLTKVLMIIGGTILIILGTR